MYLLTAISNDGEVILMHITEEDTIANVVTNILSTARTTSVTVTRLSEENIERNFKRTIRDSKNYFAPLHKQTRSKSMTISSPTTPLIS